MKRPELPAVLVTAAFCMMVGVGAIVSILPGRILALSGAGASLGLLSTSFGVAYVLAQLPVGYLADRFGVRAFLTGGYLVCAGAGLIFLGRFIQGLGEAPVWALGPALLSVQYAERRGAAMGRYNAAIHIGLTALFFVLFYAMISVSQLVVGPVVDRMGRRRFMRAGLAAGAVGPGLFPFVGLWWAMGLLTLAAFGLGAFYLASMTRLNDAAPAQLKGSISGAYYLAWGLGMSVTAVGVEALSAWLHPGAGFVAFAALLGLQAVVAGQRRRRDGVFGSRI